MTNREARFLKFLVGPLLLIIAVTCALLLAGYPTAAYIVGNPGTLLYLIGLVVWIAVVDSRKRWPDVGWFTRLSYVLTFKR